MKGYITGYVLCDSSIMAEKISVQKGPIKKIKAYKSAKVDKKSLFNMTQLMKKKEQHYTTKTSRTLT